MNSFTHTETFDIPIKILFDVWLDQNLHALATGTQAEIHPVVNGNFTAWDGYITGSFTLIEPYKKITMNWRTADFSEPDIDSKVILAFSELGTSSTLILTHTHIPDGQPDYKQGWIDHYFAPMRTYFLTLD